MYKWGTKITSLMFKTENEAEVLKHGAFPSAKEHIFFLFRRQLNAFIWIWRSSSACSHLTLQRWVMLHGEAPGACCFRGTRLSFFTNSKDAKVFHVLKNSSNSKIKLFATTQHWCISHHIFTGAPWPHLLSGERVLLLDSFQPRLGWILPSLWILCLQVC